LKEAVEAETDVSVVGYLRPDPSVTIQDRHLGLVMAVEHKSAELYDQLARAAMDTIDLDLIESLARSAGRFSSTLEALASLNGGERHVRVGVADDPAFCFYYPENLDLLRIEGCRTGEVLTDERSGLAERRYAVLGRRLSGAAR
jgi:cobyrinic acid a,c-diamide synthase